MNQPENRVSQDRLMMGLLISSVWATMVVMEKLLPEVSAVILLLLFMSLYTTVFLSAGMIHQKRKTRKNPQKPDFGYKPKVSILIPAHNEESVIENTVRMVMALDYPDYDLWVIDDRSVDQTARILERLSAQFPKNFFYYTRSAEAYPGKSAVLNEAIEKADGEIICVFDADAIIEVDFLSQMVPFLADEEVGAVQARKIIANANYNWLTRCQNEEYAFDAHMQCGRNSIHGAVELRGNGQLVKREALEEIGGWNNQSLTDDLDLSTRLHVAGWDIRFAHKVMVGEEGITEFLPLLRQRRRWAEGSLRRYLHYAGSLVCSPYVALRTKVDMVSWFTQFLLPLWVISDYLVVGIDYFAGNPHQGHLISSLFVLPLASSFFLTGLFIAILRFEKGGISNAVVGSICTSIYMTWVWIPLALWIMGKVLFQKKQVLDWGKTEHRGHTIPAQDYAVVQESSHSV